MAHDGEKIGFSQTRALGQFLGVPQFFLGHFFLCHVLRQNVKAKDGTIFRYARREGSLYLASQIACGIEANQVILPRARQCTNNICLNFFLVCPTENFGNRTSDNFLRRLPVPRLISAVGELIASVLADKGNQGRHVIG